MNPQSFVASRLGKEAAWINMGQAILLPANQQSHFQNLLNATIPELSKRMVISGYDWIGRPFGVSRDLKVILIYDSMFDELMEFPWEGDDILASPLFDPDHVDFGQELLASFLSLQTLSRIELGFCAGFTIPPLFGGEVATSNMELYEIDTYWALTSMIQEIDEAWPEGTVLRSLKID